MCLAPGSGWGWRRPARAGRSRPPVGAGALSQDPCEIPAVGTSRKKHDSNPMESGGFEYGRVKGILISSYVENNL
jgi:hypothetical protein